MEWLLQDLRFGIRTLLKNPGFTAVPLLTLALGIGTNIAIFSVVHAVLLRPLRFPHPERLVIIGLNEDGDVGSFTPAEFLALQREQKVCASRASKMGACSHASAHSAVGQDG
jgi:hypothetical protein